MKKNNAGYSLVEMIVAVAISAVAFYVLSQSVVDVFRDSKIISQAYESKNESAILMGFVQRTILRSDVTPFAYHAHGSVWPSEPLARFVVPYYNMCANRTTTCMGRPSVLWGHYENRSPVIPVACALDSENLIVDLQNNEQGAMTLSNPDIVVAGAATDYPSGKINLAVDSVIGLLDEPTAVALKVSGSVVSYNPGWNAVTQTFTDPLFENNPDCRKMISNYTNLIKIPVAPLILPDTGGTVPTPAAMLASFGVAPYRLINLKIFNLGVESSTYPTKVSLRTCDHNFICDKEVLSIPEVTGFHLQTALSKPMAGDTAIIPFSNVTSTTCVFPACRTFFPGIKIDYKNVGETTDALNATMFSLFKLNFIRSISFYIDSNVLTSTEQTRQNREVFHATTF